MLKVARDLARPSPLSLKLRLRVGRRVGKDFITSVLGWATTTYFYGRVGSLPLKMTKILVGSGRVVSLIWSVVGRFRFVLYFQKK